MTNISVTTKSPFFTKSIDESIFLTELGTLALENIKKSYLKKVQELNPHRFLSISPSAKNLSVTYYKSATRTYKSLPLTLWTPNPLTLSYTLFTPPNSVEYLVQVLQKSITWYESIGFKVVGLKLKEEFKEIFEAFPHCFQKDILAPSEEECCALSLSLNENIYHETLLRQITIEEKLDYMTKEGIRVKPSVWELTVLRDTPRFLNTIAQHYSNTLPSDISPIRAVVLSVSEKWEDLAKLVALKLNAEVDNSSDPVGKKIRNWKSLGCAEIYVVGEKDMKELCETGKITLTKNSINVVMESVVVSFI